MYVRGREREGEKESAAYAHSIGSQSAFSTLSPYYLVLSPSTPISFPPFHIVNIPAHFTPLRFAPLRSFAGDVLRTSLRWHGERSGASEVSWYLNGLNIFACILTMHPNLSQFALVLIKYLNSLLNITRPCVHRPFRCSFHLMPVADHGLCVSSFAECLIFNCNHNQN